MRCTLLALLLSTGTLAFGQAATVPPEQSDLTPSPWAKLNREFDGMTAQKWKDLGALPSWSVLLPPPKQAVARLGDDALDPQMVHHPSPKNLGTRPPGTQVAQSLFPGLAFQPIDQAPNVGTLCAPAFGPLSTKWPMLNVQRIPTDWPKLKMEPVVASGEAFSSAIPSPKK